jgi:hypothetical protein
MSLRAAAFYIGLATAIAVAVALEMERRERRVNNDVRRMT